MAKRKKTTKKENPSKKGSGQTLQGLTDIEMKLLRLALDKGAYDGEAANAAVMLVRKLRERGATADGLFGGASYSSSKAITNYGDTKMTFGKYRDEMIKDIPISYLVWAVNNCSNMDGRLRLAITKFLEEVDY